MTIKDLPYRQFPMRNQPSCLHLKLQGKSSTEQLHSGISSCLAQKRGPKLTFAL